MSGATDNKPGATWLAGLRGAMGRSRPPASRSYRYLAQQIDRDFPAQRGGVALGFCCPDGDALSTEVILMQAATLQSELGASVLMIDARVRNEGGGLSEFLGLDDRLGYAEVVGSSAVDLATLIKPTGIDHVSVLPQGGQQGSVVIHRDRLSSLVQIGKSRYRFVLIQLGSVIADTRNLVTATHTDAVMLLAHEDRTLMRDLTAAQVLLESNGVADVRVVLAAKAS